MNKADTDRTGKRYGRLLVLSIASAHQETGQVWNVQCDCGTVTTASSRQLTGGKESCGCLKTEALAKLNTNMHGHCRRPDGTRSPTYNSWRNMRSRCTPTGHAHERYFDVGIRVCERWSEFANFLADMGERPEGKTLDRIDNDRGYEPDNCRWATPMEQSHNRRKGLRWIEVAGVRKCLKEWARLSGLSKQAIRRRIEAGWAPELAVTTPRLPNRGRATTRLAAYPVGRNEPAEPPKDSP